MDCEDAANAEDSMEEYEDLGGTSGTGREGHRDEDRDTPSLSTILYTPVKVYTPGALAGASLHPSGQVYTTIS